MNTHDGSFSKRLVPGSGVFAALLEREGIPVLTEEEYLSKGPEGREDP